MHGRVMSLFEQIIEKIGDYICGMDNLSNSSKFAKKTLNESGK